MAFDDFEPADADSSVPQGPGDDLFDFPLVDPFGVAGAQSSDAPAEAGASAAAPTQGAPVSTTDDDDLFGDDMLGEVSMKDFSSDFEADIDRISERVTDMIEDDDLESYIAEPEAQDEISDAIAPGDSPEEQAAPVAAVHAAPAPTAAVSGKPTRQATVTPAAPQAGRFALGRVGLVFGGLAALFAFALLGVVWNTGRGMQAALASRTQETTDTQLQARIAELELLMANQREELLAALSSQGEEVLDPLPTGAHVEPEWYVERKLIQEALNEGRFREARKRLFALQAVMDELEPEVREDLAPTVAFLIPETYRLQAEAAGGEQ